MNHIKVCTKINNFSPKINMGFKSPNKFFFEFWVKILKI